MNNYVYVYCDPRKNGIFVYGKYCFDHEPYYVGLGKNDRIYHLLTSDLKRYSVNKTKQIINEGFDPIFFKFKNYLERKKAIGLEIDMIKTIGRKNLGLGPLTNLTDGGEGLLNLIRTKEHNNNISIANKGRKISDKQKKQISETLKRKGIKPPSRKGSTISEEHKRKISKSNKGKKLSEETKEKLRKKATGRKHSKETKKYLSDIQKGKPKSKETKEKMMGRTPWNKGKKMSEDAKRKLSISKTGRKMSEETKQKISETMKRKYK